MEEKGEKEIQNLKMKKKLESYIEDEFSEEDTNYYNNNININKSDNNYKNNMNINENNNDTIHEKISEKNKSKIFFPGYDGPLLSISLFNELQHNILPYDKIQKAYKEYKLNFETKKINSFYIEHHNEEWFKEKYDTKNKLNWKFEKNLQSKKISEKFQEDFKEGLFKDLKFDLLEKDENNKKFKIMDHYFHIINNNFEEKERENIFSLGNINRVNEENQENSYSNYNSFSNLEVNISDAHYFSYDPDKYTIFFNSIPKNISRLKILEILKKIRGFMSLYISEPIKRENFIIYYWASFDCEFNFEKALQILSHYKVNNEYYLNPIKSKSNSIKKIRLTPRLFEDRIEKDLKYSKSLMEIFDEEKEIKVKRNLNKIIR
jgi:hypothetical protein